jgi:DNA-directed RNA polymerase sigma subunit (sigma70/sigma32)
MGATGDDQLFDMLTSIYGAKARRIKDEAIEPPIKNREFDIEALEAIIPTLDVFSQEVVISRFGLGESEPRSVFQVASQLGLTPEKVFGLVNQALRTAMESTVGSEELAELRIMESLVTKEERWIMANYFKKQNTKTDEEIGIPYSLSSDDVNQIRLNVLGRISPTENINKE